MKSGLFSDDLKIEKKQVELAPKGEPSQFNRPQGIVFIDKEAVVSMSIALISQAPVSLADRNRVLQQCETLTNRLSTVWMEFDVSFGVNASIHLSIRQEKVTQTTDGKWFKEYIPKIDLGWGSTTRTITQALAAVNLYKEVVDFAALLDTVLTDCVIGEICDEEE